MKIGRTDSQGEQLHFFRIKDLHFFRHLLWRYDLSLVKDYLHSSLSLILVDPFLPYRLDCDCLYVPSEEAQLKVGEGGERVMVRYGHALPEGIGQFTSDHAFSMYRISKKTVLILEKLYFLEVPMMKGMKSSEKLSFLERCEVIPLHFNSFVYRRGEEVDAIYYLLEGQVKLFKELGENVYEVASLERGRIFGLFEVKGKSRSRELYAKASLNPTTVLKISAKLMEKVCQEREVTMQALLNDAKSQLYSLMKSEHEGKLLNAKGKETKPFDSNSRVQLERRLKTFESSRMIKSSVIENLVYSKKMLFRVKELNERMQGKRNGAGQAENCQSIRHSNDKWRVQRGKGKEQGQPRVATAGRSPFRRLMKYPSVQRYLCQEQGRQIDHC